MVHLLFGGTKTKPQKHKSCRIHIGNLEGTYKCDFIALQQDTVCQDIPSVCTGPWTDALKEKNVHLSDTGEDRASISLLIGADVAGKLFTGKVIQLSQGTTAIETKLGWTILDSNSEDSNNTDTTLMVVSMLSHEASVSELWKLDTLGITDPIENINKEARQEEIKALFQETTRITEEGRFEVVLPWKDNHPPLQDNRDMAEKRLDIVTKKLKQESLFDGYGTIFRN